jgi:putative heme-binding domain-containing protein
MKVLSLAILDVPTPEGALFAFNYINKNLLPEKQLVTYLQYISRYVPTEQAGLVIDLIRKRFPENPDVQFTLYSTIRQGVAQRGGQVSQPLKDWGITLASEFMSGFTGAIDPWNFRPLDPAVEGVNPWGVVDRQTLRNFAATENSEMNNMFKVIDPASPGLSAKYITSEFNGTAQTGILVSAPFPLPASLKMAVYDNDIHRSVQKKGQSQNSIRVKLAGNGMEIGNYRQVLDQPAIPGDLLNIVTLNLEAYKGQMGYIEVTDSSKQGAVAISLLETQPLAIPEKGPAELATRRINAANIAEDYKLASLEPALKKLVAATWADAGSRLAAAEALMAISPESNQFLLSEIFNRRDEPVVFRQNLAGILGQSTKPPVLEALVKGFTGAQPGLQVAIASVLANSGAGIDYLIEAIQKKTISPELLVSPKLKERLAANMKEGQEQQLNNLSAGIQTEKDARRKLIEARLASFDPASVSATSGRQTFIQNCSMCHQIGGTGGMIGPQLNGVGSWGQKALTEKILDPNRNISESFRVYNITLKNGRTVTGLFRREEGETMIFANAGGQEFSLAKNEIQDRKASKYTLMPDYFSTTIAKKDFDALVKYLLTLKE